MNSRYFPWVAVALTLTVMVLAIDGVSITSLLVALMVLACPMLMMLKADGHGFGGDDGTPSGDRPLDMSKWHGHGPTPGRP